MQARDNRAFALPDDPTGIEEAHDILAAEDFAMPSGPDRFGARLRSGGGRGPLAILAAATLAAVAYAALRRR